MSRFRLPSVRQLDLLFGRVLRLPADTDGSFHDELVEFVPVVVDLSPAQARWMGVDPTRPASRRARGVCSLAAVLPMTGRTDRWLTSG